MRPLLSIVTVTAFDYLRLQRTISTTQFEIANIEHVFIAPTNDLKTIEIIKEYSISSKFAVKIYFDNNEGIYQAMNLGAVKSNGEYLFFLNSGDEILDVAVFQSNLILLSNHSPSWAILGVKLPWCDSYLAHSNMHKNFRRQSKHGYVSHQSVIVRKSVFANLGMLDTKFPIAADTKLIFQVAQLATPLLLPGISVKVEAGFNVTSHNRESRLEVFKIINSVGKPIDIFISNINFLLREIKFLMRKIVNLRLR